MREGGGGVIHRQPANQFLPAVKSRTIIWTDIDWFAVRAGKNWFAGLAKTFYKNWQNKKNFQRRLLIHHRARGALAKPNSALDKQELKKKFKKVDFLHITERGGLALPNGALGKQELNLFFLKKVDFLHITERGGLALPNGALGEQEFVLVMCKQVSIEAQTWNKNR